VTVRCTLVIPDAGPLNSLWLADSLPLLLRLNMPIVVLDAIYDEVGGEPRRYAKDRDVKAFLDLHSGGAITVETTFVGQQARHARARGEFVPGKGMGDAAIAEFMATGVERYIADDATVLLLFEDADFRNVHFLNRPDNLHLLSTVAMLRGLEEVGVIASADAVLQAMLHPADPERRRYARALTDLPEGTDLPAPLGSTWKP
jgi:hypothetical protein